MNDPDGNDTTVDWRLELARCVAAWIAAGWVIESQSDNMVVLVRRGRARTTGQAYMRAGIFSVIANNRNRNEVLERITLYADENGLKRLN